MKKYVWLIALSLGLFMSCQSNTKMESTDDSSGIDTNNLVVTQQSCYTYIKNKDTATLSMMTSGQVATGELSYSLFEKDRNHGMIRGEMRGDTLIADYTFNSEGKESIRQIVFLKKDNLLIEGFGDIIEKDGKTVFKDISTLKFSNGMEFTKVICK